MTYTPEQLVGYILRHSHKAWVAQGHILVVDSWLPKDSQTWVDEIIMLSTDLKTVQRWLGY